MAPLQLSAWWSTEFKCCTVKKKKKHIFPPPLNSAPEKLPWMKIKFNSCRADGNHMHLDHIDKHVHRHTFNNNFRDGTRGELHSHFMGGARNFRLWVKNWAVVVIIIIVVFSYSREDWLVEWCSNFRRPFIWALWLCNLIPCCGQVPKPEW